MPNPPIHSDRALAIRTANASKLDLKQFATEGNLSLVGEKLIAFNEAEKNSFFSFRSIMINYLQLPASPRPLNLAVFGQPGSGKSYVVKTICEEIEKEIRATKLHFISINLTELTSASELIKLIRRILLDKKDGQVPVIFIDEFDAPLAGVPLGWLSRFLAPMEDSSLLDAGDRLELRRAIFIFAGGTSSRMEDFGGNSEARFREAKGPDFVSRLSGYLDLSGPNDQQRTDLRRAYLIQTYLAKINIASDAKSPGPTYSLDDALLHAMLGVGRYRHGARSIRAIIEMAAASVNGPRAITLDDLPPDHLLKIHRDLGPLDPISIGGLIGLSAAERDKSRNRSSSLHWRNVTLRLVRELWKIGAVVGYGGKLADLNLTSSLQQVLSQEAASLVNGAALLTREPKPKGQVRIEVFARESIGSPPDLGPGTIVAPVPEYSNSQQAENVLLGKAARAFRARWMMSCRCVARVLVYGKLRGYSGRMPGTLEEAMLALSLGQPLYIIGGFGGGAQVVGELLGLASGWPRQVRKVGSFGPRARDASEMDAAVASSPFIFRPAGFPHLPLTFGDAMDFVTGYSIGGPGWPPNGLTVEENRTLFVTTDESTIVELVRKGLVHRFQTQR
jgi:hypothetical protein